jgi:hypothetical protein
MGHFFSENYWTAKLDVIFGRERQASEIVPALQGADSVLHFCRTQALIYCGGEERSSKTPW